MNLPPDERESSTTPRWVRDLGHDANVFPICFLLVLVVLATFFPAVFCGFTHYDDQDYVTGNAHVQQGLTWAGIKWAFGAVVSSNWHPLTLISHELDCQLFGPKAWGHHLTSLWFHAANAALVFVVFRKLTGAAGRSLIVALLFALHPLRVESVAWVAERKDVLCAFFWLLTMWAYADYVKKRKTRGSDAKVYYGRALLFFALGLMAKPMMVTLPFVLLLADYWDSELGEQKHRTSNLEHQIPNSEARQPNWKWLIVEKIPFFLLTGISCVVTYLAQQAGGSVDAAMSFNERAANAVVSYWRYLYAMLWPAKLAVFYPFPDQWPLALILAAGLGLVAVTMLVVFSRRKRPYLPVGWFWYLGTLVPVIGIVQVGVQSMANRYTYLPMIGLLVLAVWGLHDLTKAWRNQAAVAVATSAVLCLMCCGMTRRQIGFWKDDEIIFRHALEAAGKNWFAENNLAAALFADGRPEEAMEYLRVAQQLSPNSYSPYNNLGNVLKSLGRLDEAIAQYRTAVKLAPKLSMLHNNLAITLKANGQLDEAIAEYQETLRLNPRSEMAAKGLADALSRKNGGAPVK